MAESTPPIQIFGRKDSRESQRALRFFSDRRATVSFVDLARKAPAATELRRFAARGGAAALFDTESRTYREAGLGYLRMTDDEALERLMRDARLLRLPLVGWGAHVTVGRDEATWKEWLASGAGS